MDTTHFNQFLDHCIGNWTTERTYHYLSRKKVERSRTTFQVKSLTAALKLKVLADNQYPPTQNIDTVPGFSLAFHTVSEEGEEVSQQLNLAFVSKTENGGILEGDYIRDKAYEESRPIISHFRFDRDTKELLMTTQYAKIVSVDSITLINPTLRIRRIYNYQKPIEGQPLDTLLLVGFGVEQNTP